MVRCYYDLQGDFTEFSLGNVRSLKTASTFRTDQRSTRALRNTRSRPAASGPPVSSRSFRIII